MKDLLESIKHHEGYREKTYQCTEGYNTIGIGFAWKDIDLDEGIALRLLKDNMSNQEFINSIKMSEDICDEILLRKLRILGRSVMGKFPFFDSLPSDCKDVLMEMCYQLGVTGVSKFKKALKAMEDGDWEKAADEMLDSKWAKQTPNRAKEMSNIVRSLHEKKSSSEGDSNT